MPKSKEKLIVPREVYLSAGVHIGMTTKTADMKKFIYKVRPSGLAVLNVGMLDKRIGIITNMLAKKSKILLVSRKESSSQAVNKFAEAVGARAITGRFMPGTLTNPQSKDFYEPDILIITDPLEDKQAMTEALQMRIPIVGLADTFNETSYIDFVLPCNNKGKKSLALVFWLLSRLIKEKRGEAFDMKMEDFGYEMDAQRPSGKEEGAEAEQEEAEKEA
ncbi:MAG: 30S ribosomal protein S2 [Candidatus Aenigmarchaeota archaeon]|nr:30S ribosomal protein S2 [Candidatus Aenigmarchaeota archaeon]